MGRIVGLFGIKGWVKVHSYARPRAEILNSSPWQVKLPEGWRELKVAEGRAHGQGVVVRLEGFEDRERAAQLVGAEIALRREQLPALKPGEYYWAQLEGLKVVNREGVELGVVSHLLETGANDVLVVSGDRERLIPFIAAAIRRVDLEAGVIEVDWEADF